MALRGTYKTQILISRSQDPLRLLSPRSGQPMRDMSPVRDRLGCVLAVWCSLACRMGAIDQKAMMTKCGSQQCMRQSWAGHAVIVLEELASVQMACTGKIFCQRATQSRRKLSFAAGLPRLPPVGGRSPAGGFSQES